MIYDNAEKWTDIHPGFWPLPGTVGSIIVTSRDFALANSPASDGIELTKLSRQESRDFVDSLLRDWESDSKEEQEALDQLLAQLDGLPLALHQISSLICADGSSVRDFLEDYNEHADEVHQDRAGGHSPYYPHSIDTVWSLTCQRISSSETPEDSFLLGIICVLSPDGIPEKLFQPPRDLQVPGDDAGLCANGRR